MEEEVVTESELRLIKILKKCKNLDRDDAIAIGLLCRVDDITDELAEWLKNNMYATCEEVLEYIYTELVEPGKMTIIDDDD